MFRHIRSKLIAAFAVPLAVVIAVSAFGTYLAIGQLRSANGYSALISATVGPAGVVQDLQAERQYAILDILHGASTAPTSLAGLSATRVMLQTDAAVRNFQDDLASATHQQQKTYAAAVAALAGLPHARAEWAPARASLHPLPDAVAVAQATNQAYGAMVYGLSAATASLPAPLHRDALIQLVLFGLVLVIGAAALFVLVTRVSASVSTPLIELARQAEELAEVALPATVRSILDAKDDGETPKLPSIDVDGKGEVAEMARAIEAVGKTAVELAAGQAALRRNLAEAFVNLGRRNQNLVTRQLEYISEIELKEADPESLEELFRLDHLATRMRRNAESLLILAGSGPARQWSAAVPAMDVARAASAEVEDYKRLRLHHFDHAQIAGSVTTDLVHILAELIENALCFSPPGSPVDLYGRFLEGGYVIVIVDSGIGMSEADLETANRRLQGEGPADEVPGRYLGHFVAGRLAARHGISISLQASHSGGLVARVKVPEELIEEPVADLSASSEARLAAPSSPSLHPSSPAPHPSSPAPHPSSPAPPSSHAAGMVAFAGPPTGVFPAPSATPTARPPVGPPPTAGAFQPAEPLQPAEPPNVGPPTPVGAPPRVAPLPAAPPNQPVAAAAPTQPSGEVASSQPADTPAPPPAGPAAPDLTILSPLVATQALTEAESTGFEGRPSLAAAQNRRIEPPEQAIQPAQASNGSVASPLSSQSALPTLAQRVPGASLPPENGWLRRETPTKTARDPMGLTAALSQYLSATSNDNRPEKGDKTR